MPALTTPLLKRTIFINRPPQVATLSSWPGTKPSDSRSASNFICDVRWDDMDPTASPGVRNCSQCDKAVLAAPTEADVDHHTSLGHCVFSPTVHGSLLVAKPEDPPGPPPLAGAPVPSPESIPVPNPPPPRPSAVPRCHRGHRSHHRPAQAGLRRGRHPGALGRGDGTLAEWAGGAHKEGA